MRKPVQIFAVGGGGFTQSAESCSHDAVVDLARATHKRVPQIEAPQVCLRHARQHSMLQRLGPELREAHRRLDLEGLDDAVVRDRPHRLEWARLVQQSRQAFPWWSNLGYIPVPGVVGVSRWVHCPLDQITTVRQTCVPYHIQCPSAFQLQGDVGIIPVMALAFLATVRF